MASPVLSVQKHTLTILGVVPDTEDTAALTDSPAAANCIPFATTRVVGDGAQADSFSAYAALVDFTGGDTVRARTSSRDLGSREIVIETTVVEFNPAEVNVYSGEYAWDGVSPQVVSSPFGAAVDLSKSFLYFTYWTDSGNEFWRQHTIRGRITDTNELTFTTLESQGATPGETTIRWYVAEAINTAWAVDAVDIVIADLASSGEDTFTAVGNDAKTFVLGSHEGSGDTADADSNADNTIDVTLTDSGGDTWDTVTATRSGTGDVITWSGFVVELTGNENVYRGTLTTSAASPDPAGHTSIGATVTEADSMVHPAGSCGHLGNGSHTGIESADVSDSFCAWTLFSPTQIDCEHKTAGGESGGSVSWEVIEWDVGAAGPVRRVMVIS